LKYLGSCPDVSQKSVGSRQLLFGNQSAFNPPPRSDIALTPARDEAVVICQLVVVAVNQVEDGVVRATLFKR